MKTKTNFLIGIAPYYQTKPVWVEELLDFLVVFPEADLFVPNMMLNNQINLEINRIIPFLKQQFTHCQTYGGNLELHDVTAFEQNYQQTLQKMLHYFDSTKTVTLETMQEDVYFHLFRQCGMLLPMELQQDYQQLQKILYTDLLKKLSEESSRNTALCLVPLEHLSGLLETFVVLQTTYPDWRVFRYGDEYLEIEE